MRDPKRIPEILKALRRVWEQYPDLRLGQLIDNATVIAGPASVFHVEDDVLLDALRKMADA